MKRGYCLTILIIFYSFSKLIAQVHLQTGAAQVSIPLYSYADAGNRLITGVSLNYVDGNGLKVSEMATSVGTGWALGLGGVITRIQHGEPDDQQNTYATAPIHPDDNYYPKGYIYDNQFSPADVINNGAGYTPFSNLQFNYKKHPKYLADREQDEFSFSFNGRQGTFVIGRNKSIRMLEDSKLKILPPVETDMTASNIRTRISEFDILDETGIKYVFKTQELSEVLVYDNKYTSANTQVVQGRGLGQYVVSKWYLSEIANPLTGKKITFTYESYNVSTNGDKMLHKSYVDGTDGAWQNVLLVSKVSGVAQRIKTITLSNSETVSFVYSNMFRFDLPYDKALDEIQIRYKGNIKYRWKFGTGYAYLTSIKSTSETTIDNFQKTQSRLYLMSIQKLAPVSEAEPKYIFDYNIPTGSSNQDYIAPMFSSFQDHWGYYTKPWGIPSEYISSTNPADFLSSAGYLSQAADAPATYRPATDKWAAFGILKSVTYPTGGSLSFVYEQNLTADVNGIAHVIGGVRVSQTTAYDGLDHTKDIITEYKYQKEDGTTSGWGYEDPIYARSVTLKVNKNVNGTTALTQLGQIVSFMPNSYALVRFISSNSNKILKDGPLKSFLQTSLGSVVGAFVISLVVEVILNKIIYWLQSTYKEYTSAERSSWALNGNNLLPLQYSRVEVRSLGTTSVGKTAYEFTSPADLSMSTPTLALPYSNRPRLYEWAYGLPLKITVYDASLTNKIRVTVNNYTFYPAVISDPNFESKKWEATKLLCQYYDAAFDPTTVVGSTDIAYDDYYPLTGHAELYQTTETITDENGQSIVNTVNYNYSSNNYLVNKTATTNSEGESIETYTYYPEDYSLTGTIQQMKTNNMVNVPVCTQTFVVKSTRTQLVSGSVNEFGVIGNNDIKVINAYTFQNTTPVDKSLVAFSGAQLLPNAQYYKVDGSLHYNTAGQVDEVDTKNATSSTLYAYDNQLPVAVAENAKNNEIFFDSFEEDGTWNGVVYDPIQSHLGNQSARIDKPTAGEVYYYSKKSLSVSLTTPTVYKYCGWVYSNGPSAQIYLQMKSATATTYSNVSTTQIGKWVYLEGKFTVPTGVTSMAIRIDNNGGGTVWFDDIRLYPYQAMMTSYTYEPLMGVTSQTDDDNNSIQYAYYDLGRVTVVKDEDGNVRKKYCSNYQSQTESCTIYGNQEMIQYFDRQGCSNCQVGSSVLYTVPANKYYSTTQAGANAQAQAELDANGQNTANANGSCVVPSVAGINGYNSIGSTVKLTFNNKCSGQSYYRDLTVGTTSLIGIPEGKYDIIMAPTSSGNFSYRIDNGFALRPGTGQIANFYNIDINGTITIVVSL